MPNRLDKKIAEIRSEVVECLTRTLAAVELDSRRPNSSAGMRTLIEQVGSDPEDLLARTLAYKAGIRYGFIAQGITSIDKDLAQINTKEVLITRKQGLSTSDIFESYIDDALSRIDDSTSGILESINELFCEQGNDRPTTTSLNLLHEVTGKTKIIRRQLNVLKRPSLGWVFSFRIAGLLLLCALIAIPIGYAFRAHSVNRSTTPEAALPAQIEKDKSAIKKELRDPEKSAFDKIVAVTGLISKTITLVPQLLAGLALLIGLYQYLFVKQRWRESGLDDFRKDLLAASENLKRVVSGGKGGEN